MRILAIFVEEIFKAKEMLGGDALTGLKSNEESHITVNSHNVILIQTKIIQ